MEARVFLLLFSCITQIAALDIIYNTEFGEKIVGEGLNNYLFIHMHEEIEQPYLLATFEETSGETPKIEFTTPDQFANSALGLDVIESPESPGIWEMIITNRQDYEGSYFEDIEKVYTFAISTSSETTFVEINLVNINDNEPMVFVNNSTCILEENDDAISSCSYTIKDDDGYMTKMSWSLGYEYDNVFRFDYEPIADDNVKEITLYLEPIYPLDYETVPLYIMQLTVTDTPIVKEDEAHSGAGNIVVSVRDLPDTDPVWVIIFASAQFSELTAQMFQVTARDGDIGVNDAITYTLDNDWPQYISIKPDTGLITVEPIDRDTDGEIIYTFTVIACEVYTQDACVQQLVTFLVEDLNNKFPEITVHSTSVTTIPENSFGNLEFIISAHDMDMGENAMYDILLDSVDGQHQAFTVAPGVGYQKSDIYIYIVDPTLLDYDRNDIWREFTLQLITIDVAEPRNLYREDLTIILENVNDEVPQFVYGDEDDESAYIANVLETAPIDEIVKVISATDADIGDFVRYALLGTYINGILTIDSETGVIRTAINGAFDYETQEEIVLQVQVTDTFADEYNSPLNTAVASLIINVIDVNDETPRISVGSNQIRIDENQKHGTIIINAEDNYLVASDDDQTASLEFVIEWDNSYATKIGQRLSDDKFAEYHNCINLSWEAMDTATGKGKSITAEFRINEVVPENTPNFELFDTLYIQVTAIDKNQEINFDRVSVIVPIYIDDVNDWCTCTCGGYHYVI